MLSKTQSWASMKIIRCIEESHTEIICYAWTNVTETPIFFSILFVNHVCCCDRWRSLFYVPPSLSIWTLEGDVICTLLCTRASVLYHKWWCYPGNYFIARSLAIGCSMDNISLRSSRIAFRVYQSFVMIMTYHSSVTWWRITVTEFRFRTHGWTSTVVLVSP